MRSISAGHFAQERGKRDARFDVVFLANDVAGDLEPQLFPKQVVIFRLVGVDLGELEVVALEREVDARLVQAHLGVNEYASLHALVSAAEAQSIV